MSHPVPLPSPPPLVNPLDPVDSDVDDEVDQLISDSESPETDPDAQNPAAAHRVPGHTLLPPVRLENIMSADGVTGNLSLSKEGLFILSVAAEEFIKKMAQAGHLRASNERRTSVNYSDMCAATQQYQEFMFLKETIPVPIPLSEAISLRAQKEKEAQESDPTAPSSSSRPSTSLSAPKKAKSRPNGTTPKHDKRSTKEPRPTSNHADSDGTYSEWTDTRPPRPGGGRPAISAYNGRLSLAPRPSPLSNGHSVSAAPSRSSTITPAQSHDPTSDAASTQHQPSATASPYPAQPDESWSSQPPYATGPASGFLQGPGGPFGRVLQNPGRTIYSQEYRTE